MTPILYPADALTFGTYNATNKTMEYTGFICALTDTISCVVEEERNGIFECTFEYPQRGTWFREIKVGRIVMVPHDVTMKPQPFDIYAFEVNSEGIATYRARHISYRLTKLILKPTQYAGDGGIGYDVFGPLTFAMNFIVSTTRSAVAYNKHINMLPNGAEFTARIYGFSTPEPEFTNKHTWGGLKSARDELLGAEGSILDWFGGEYEWDWFTVKLHKRRGTDTSIIIRYGNNLAGMTYEFDGADMVDGVAPYWMDSYEYQVATGERRVNPETGMDEPVYTTERIPFARYFNGNTVFAELIGPDSRLAVAPYDEHYLVGDAFTALPVEVSIDKDEDSAENLNDKIYAAADKYYRDNHQGNNYERLTVDFTRLSNSAEYAEFAGADSLVLCDTVTFFYPEIGINRQLKLTKTTFDVLTERYTKLEFGASARNLFNTDKTNGEYTGNEIQTVWEGDETITISTDGAEVTPDEEEITPEDE